MDTLLFIVFLGIVIFSSIYGYFEISKLKDKEITERFKVKHYRKTILDGWLMVIVVLAVSAVRRISLKDIGITTPNSTSFDVSILIKVIVFIVCGLLLLNLIYQIIGFLSSESFRMQIVKQVEKSEANESRFNKVLYKIIVPRTFREKVWFALMSATAGIGEEIVYRGFLSYHLMRHFPEWPLALLIISAGIIFGFAHFYQGITGIVRTSILGTAFGALYISSGSLLPGIILHFIIDVSANFLKPSAKGDAYTKI